MTIANPEMGRTRQVVVKSPRVSMEGVEYFAVFGSGSACDGFMGLISLFLLPVRGLFCSLSRRYRNREAFASPTPPGLVRGSATPGVRRSPAFAGLDRLRP